MHEMHILLAHDPLLSLVYPMITHTSLVAGNLPIKILVARQQPTNTHTHTHTYDSTNKGTPTCIYGLTQMYTHATCIYGLTQMYTHAHMYEHVQVDSSTSVAGEMEGAISSFGLIKPPLTLPQTSTAPLRLLLL